MLKFLICFCNFDICHKQLQHQTFLLTKSLELTNVKEMPPIYLFNDKNMLTCQIDYEGGPDVHIQCFNGNPI